MIIKVPNAAPAGDPDDGDKFRLESIASIPKRNIPCMSPEFGADLVELLTAWAKLGKRRTLVKHARLDLSRAGLMSRLHGGREYVRAFGSHEDRALVNSVHFEKHELGYVLVPATKVKARTLLEAMTIEDEEDPFEQVRVDLDDFIKLAEPDMLFARPSEDVPALFNLTDGQVQALQELIAPFPQLIGSVTKTKISITKLREGDV